MEVWFNSKGIYGRSGCRNIMTMRYFIRQGDILFEKVLDKVELGAKLDTKTVALGEVTGHHHSFQKSDQVILYKQDSEQLPTQLSVLEDNNSMLTHQEHLSIQFPKGEYKIRREQSYNPFLKQIQRSLD